jgi:hypothetical protein
VVVEEVVHQDLLGVAGVVVEEHRRLVA